MDILLFTVEEVFYIKGLGAVLYPGISHSGPNARVGQPITLLRPDGQEVKTTIKGFPMINRKGHYNSAAIVLPKNIKADEIPVGSQVWLTDADETAGEYEQNADF
jgi:hypothetical protein